MSASSVSSRCRRLYDLAMAEKGVSRPSDRSVKVRTPLSEVIGQGNFVIEYVGTNDDELQNQILVSK